jgi:hypothetical protein
VTAFQSSAFQATSFQVEAVSGLPAFQSGAFQTDAFQVSGGSLGGFVAWLIFARRRGRR